jgi:serine/threonine-protein kinase RsbW
LARPCAIDYALPVNVSLFFEAEPEAVRRALQRLMLELQPHGLDPDLLGTIELVVAEALNNIVEHAHAAFQGAISLKARTVAEQMQFELLDQGLPMPGGQLPSGQAAMLDVATHDLPEGGFGWFLIRSLSQDLHYSREGDTNRLCFSLPLQPQPVGT